MEKIISAAIYGTTLPRADRRRLCGFNQAVMCIYFNSVLINIKNREEAY
jgi:hypothetical protein